MIPLAPSLLAADFSDLRSELARVEQAGLTYLHLDVMDGHFVPNISFGAPVIAALRPHSKLFFDTHLMIDRPDVYAADFVKAGADLITFHLEAPGACDPVSLINHIHSLGAKAGVSIKPATPAKAVFNLLPLVDLVLVMSVEPGFGGQSFMPEQCQKLTRLAQACAQMDVHPILEIDGGISDKTARVAVDAGADLLVAGSYLFGKQDMAEAATRLWKTLE